MCTNTKGSTAAALIANLAIIGFSKTSAVSTTIDVVSFRIIWHTLIGLGCVPAIIALLSRYTIPETPRFTMNIRRNVDQAVLDIDNFLKTGTSVVDPDARGEPVQFPRASWKDFKKYIKDGENLHTVWVCLLLVRLECTAPRCGSFYELKSFSPVRILWIRHC